jgi:hypothetical protein
MSLNSLFDITKLPTKILFVISVITGMILFASAELLETLHLENVHDMYGSGIGITFLLSSGMVAINFCIWIVKSISSRVHRKRFEREVIREVGNLNRHEKAVLREFVCADRKTISAPMDDPTISGLLDKGFLHLVQQINGALMVQAGSIVAIRIDDFVHSNLRHEHLEMKINPSQDDIDFIKRNRPNWVSRVDMIDSLMNGKF